MKLCILMGSPRVNGNTVSLVEPFVDELKRQNVEVKLINLFDKSIKPCIACRICQDTANVFGCPQKDDMQYIFDSVLEADCFVLATPIYSWYCTPPMKAVLDRLVYGMNKFYGETLKKESLWENKKCAIISTCGYKIENGADLFEQGIKRYCKHSNLIYGGMISVRDKGYKVKFMNDERIDQAKTFANKIIDLLK
ncbi:MAG TPA: flavodoxin family protein [Clostridium sp.]|uniref:flavodoxin family protein n=1 Tax=Clostridium sp. TaxID=1506 RepID=UPI002F92E705